MKTGNLKITVLWEGFIIRGKLQIDRTNLKHMNFFLQIHYNPKLYGTNIRMYVNALLKITTTIAYNL